MSGRNQLLGEIGEKADVCLSTELVGPVDGVVQVKCRYYHKRSRKFRDVGIVISQELADAMGVRHGAFLETQDVPAAPDPPATTHLYLVEILGVGVKVGVSDQPKKRLATHAKNAAVHGRSVGRVWLSTPHHEARTLESMVKGTSKSEYLKIDFDEALRRLHAEAAELHVDIVGGILRDGEW